MFTKAEIEIYDLKLCDIIVTSEPDYDDGDVIFPGGKIILDEE